MVTTILDGQTGSPPMADNIHSSEYWVKAKKDYVIDNNGTIDNPTELRCQAVVLVPQMIVSDYNLDIQFSDYGC